MSSYTTEQYAHNRDRLFQRILTYLQTDERFVAAWLTGSFGRGEEDNLSDFDLHYDSSRYSHFDTKASGDPCNKKPYL